MQLICKDAEVLRNDEVEPLVSVGLKAYLGTLLLGVQLCLKTCKNVKISRCI